jgi:fatty acid desaturase
MDLASPLRPRNSAGFLYLGCAAALTGVAAALAAGGGAAGWVLGQVLVALAFLQWFVLLHEAGHHTLFRSRALNRLAGHLAGFFALIPFHAWQTIHARHHRWTGWQDLDATTASLVPRPLAPWERLAVRVAWRTYLPLFSLLYRLSNFWWLPRVRRYVGAAEYRRIVVNVVVLLAAYAATFITVGAAGLLAGCGAGLVLSLAIQDPLLLSQHTHIPQRLSRGRKVAPFAPRAQGRFTRSLRLPAWLSALVLHFDAHELHHRYVGVPGYDLRRLAARAPNEVHWWRWLRAAKRLPGDVFLFRNRTQTGFDL